MRLLTEMREFAARYKVRAIKIVLFLIILLCVAAQIFEPIRKFVIDNSLLGTALFLAVVLLVFDAIVSPQAKRGHSDYDPVVLQHVSELRPTIEKAFASRSVRFDITAYSSETYYNILSEFFAKIEQKLISLKTLHVRILIPDSEKPMAVPCEIETRKENDDFKQETIRRAREFVGKFKAYEQILRKSGAVENIHIETRRHSFSPLFKAILINNKNLFFALYPIKETPKNISDQIIKLWDYRGTMARLIGVTAHGKAAEQELLNSYREWFEAVWHHLSQKEG